jgi:probable phosphoglycerate mutase
MNPLRLCLVRHGETAWNAEHRLQGWTDIPLNQEGERQAQALAAELRGVAFDAIFASPLQRAWRTAQAVAEMRPALPFLSDPRLRERHHGAWQGLTRDEIAERDPLQHALLERRCPTYLPPGGESMETFADRVRAVMDALRREHASTPAGALLVVAHGGVLDVVYRLATGQDMVSPRQTVLPNAAINWLVADECGWRVEAWGLAAHLEAALDDQGG